jgi:hypothetical protein
MVSETHADRRRQEMIESRDRGRRQMLARLVVTDYARDAVSKALYAAVTDGLHFGPRDLPHRQDREWIRGALAIPLQEATDAALQVLVWSLVRALAQAPDDLLARLEESHRLIDIGLD